MLKNIDILLGLMFTATDTNYDRGNIIEKAEWFNSRVTPTQRKEILIPITQGKSPGVVLRGLVDKHLSTTNFKRGTLTIWVKV